MSEHSPVPGVGKVVQVGDRTLQVGVEIEGKLLQIKLSGQLKFDTSSVLQKFASEQMDPERVEAIELLCDSVFFVDSQALAVLMAMVRQCDKKGIRLTLVNPRAFFMQLLTMTRLDKVMDIRQAEGGGCGTGEVPAPSMRIPIKAAINSRH